MKTPRKSRLVGLGAALTGSGALAVSLVGNFEGLRLVAYQDVVGVWTACYGETKGIRPGMKFTREQCDVMFVERLQEFEIGMRRCLTAPDDLPDKTYVSFLSVTYNIGVGGWCGSSMVKRANAGNLTGACDALLMWNKGGGKVLKGLTNRRQAERKLCLAGISEGTAPVTPTAPQPAPSPEQPKAPPIVVPGIAPISASWMMFVGLGLAFAAVVGLIVWRRRGR